MKIINFLRDYFFQKEIIYIEDQTSFDLVLEDIQTEKNTSYRYRIYLEKYLLS